MPIISATQQVEISRIEVSSQSGQKVNETPISPTKKLVHGFPASYAGYANRRIPVQAGPGKHIRHYPK
jgi:hypothetical protein